MLYRANMAIKTTQQVVVEPGRLAAIAGEDGHDAPHEDEGAEEYDEDDGYERDEHDDEEYEYEHAARLNDSRQARGCGPRSVRAGRLVPRQILSRRCRCVVIVRGATEGSARSRWLRRTQATIAVRQRGMARDVTTKTPRTRMSCVMVGKICLAISIRWKPRSQSTRPLGAQL